MRQLMTIAIACALLSLFGCDHAATRQRAEYSYSHERTMDELHRLQQMSQIEEVLGHDTSRLTGLLADAKDADPAEAKALLVRARDEYLRDLKGKSGVPLGGMGAGTIELWPDGGLHDWRIAGNWDLAKEPEFFCFAVRTQLPGRSPKTRVLQDVAWAGRMRTRKIAYEGRFPFVFLDYGSGDQPVSVKSRAFSPFIPHDAENSCLPAACFTFEVTNHSEEQVHVSLLSAVGAGPFLEGGGSRIRERGGLASIVYQSGPNAVALSTTSPSPTIASGWREEFLPPGFRASGRLAGAAADDNGRIAICSETELEPRETKEMMVLLFWYFPDQRQRPTHGYEMEKRFEKLGTTQKAEANKYIGRRYNRFGSIEGVQDYFLDNLDRLEAETRLWVDSIYDSSMDDFVKSLLCNSVYPFFKTSFWTEKGLFNILESTNGCANPDCIHVRYYGSIPLALLFPELDKQILRRFAKYRGPFGGEAAGQIPEQFYGFSLELPFGRPLLQNNLSFVLMVYRDYIWTGDKKFLEEMWPAVREAIELLSQKDTDADGLPDDVGIKQSYDDYDMGDSPTYISVIWLAALRATEEMAVAMRDGEWAKTCHELFVHGRDTVEKTLWGGEYYGLAEGEQENVCFADALNGQWYADMLGLGDLLDEERIRSTLAAIFRYNFAATPYGIVNGFIPGKGIDYPKQAGYFQTQTASVWTGTTFAVASLGLYRGFYEKPLQAAEQVYDNYANHLGNLWNIRESNDAESGLPMAWPFYYRPMSAWSVLLGLEGFGYNAVEARLAIRPPAKLEYLKAPLIVPGVIGELQFQRENNRMHLSLEVRRGCLSLKEIRLPYLTVKEIMTSVETGHVREDPQHKETIFVFPRLQRVLPGETIDIRVAGKAE